MIKILHPLVAAIFTVLIAPADTVAQTLAAGWATRDIGRVGAAGSTSATGGTFVLEGAGADVWGTSDAFRFTYKTLTGDGSIVAQVTGVDYIANWTKAGVMMRETLAANSRHAFMLVSANKGLAFQRRTSTAGTSTHTSGGTGRAPSYVKLTRKGATITASKSVDGSTWTQVGSDTISMASTIYVGLAVSSHVRGVLASAAFTGTRVTTASAAALQSPPPPSTSTTLRVLHWNTHHGGIGTDGRYNPGRIASWIRTMNPDIASLNEIDYEGQADAIVDALKAQTGRSWNMSFSGKGNLVISRLPISSRSRCVYPDGKRYAAHLGTVVNGRSIHVWSTHLSTSGGSTRAAEIRSLQACARNWPEARILAGDFNMQAGSAEYAVAVTGYKDAWLAAKAVGAATNFAGNCDGCTRNSRIDYVFTSKGATFLTLTSARIYDTRDASGVAASDHKPLLVVYQVR